MIIKIYNCAAFSIFFKRFLNIIQPLPLLRQNENENENDPEV